MASGIPTRRVPRRADENAPPPAPGLVSTRSRTAVPTTATLATKAASTTSIPVMKRTTSTQSALATTSSIADGKEGKGDANAVKKRSALHELPLGGTKNTSKGGIVSGKGKAFGGKEEQRGERKPLASTTVQQQGVVVAQTKRVTRSSLSEAIKIEDKSAGKRKAVPSIKSTSTSTSSSSRTREPLASSSTSNVKLAESRTKHIPSTVKEESSAPAAKRRRTSTPVVEDEDDVVGDEAQYDEDGQEVLLSSGGKGVSLRSPRKEIRPKDYGWTDLDAEDEGDPSMVSEYVIDAFNYMLEIEKNTMADPNYMEKQAELQWAMRGILMDWIIEVHSKFRLLPETLFIATNMIDRFLSARVVSLVKLQLVGLTALFIAAKYEEVICPSVTHFLHMTDGGYGVDEILKAERYMLMTLNFDLSYPNPLHFLRRVSKADAYDVQTRTVAKYFIEASCVDHHLIPFPPSLLAAASMWLARLCLDRGEWTPNLVHYSSYSEDELLPCAQAMLDYILDPDFNVNSCFYKKYAAKKYLKASVFVRDWALKRWPEAKPTGRELLEEFGEDEICTP